MIPSLYSYIEYLKYLILIGFQEHYTTYAVVIVIMSSCSILYEVWTQLSNEKRLRSLVKLEQNVQVIRDGRIVQVNSKDLVIGDAVVFNESDEDARSTIVCDMVVVNGECVIDESTLTGESVPVVKPALPFRTDAGLMYSINSHKTHTLFGGSSILQVRNPRSMISDKELNQQIIAIVICTGFSSAKGELFRSILYPKDLDFKFYRDAYKFLAMLSAVAICAFVNRVIES